MNKYTMDKWKHGRFTYYTIWEEETQNPVQDFSTQDYPGRNALNLAKKRLKELNSQTPRMVNNDN